MNPEAVFQALAEPRRREMLRLVGDEPKSVSDIEAHFDLTQQAVSHHLQVLRRAGLVAVKPAGQRRLYSVDPDGLRTAREFLEELWPRKLRRLKQVVENEAPR